MTRTPKPAPALKPSRTRTRKLKATDAASSEVVHAPDTKAATLAAPEPAPAPPPKGKLALLTSLLRREEGATLADMTAATGWRAHSVRGALAGSLKKAKGLAVTSTKAEGGARVYRIAP